MTDGEKLIPVKINTAGFREIDIPVRTSFQGLINYDVPVKTTFGVMTSKDVPIKTTVYVERIDYGLYGESIWETAPRETIFYAQGGTPNKSIATTDPYWFIKSGASETGKEGFMEMGFGQNDAHNQTDANLTGFIRVQLDGTSGEGEVKIKPVLWFYPSSVPTTAQVGMMYYDTSGNIMKYYDGTWQTFGTGGGTVGGSGTAGTITKWATGGTSIEDSVITESGGNIAMSGDLTISGHNIGLGTAPIAASAITTTSTNSVIVRAPYSSYYLWYQNDTLSGSLIKHAWDATYSDYIQLQAMAANAVGPTLWICRGANYNLMLRSSADVELMTITNVGNMTLAGDLTVSDGNIGAGAAPVANNAFYGYQNVAADLWLNLDNDYVNRGCYIKTSNDNDAAGGVYSGFIVATAGTVTQKWNMGMSGSTNWKLQDTINTKTCIEVVPNTGDTTILGDLTVSGGKITLPPPSGTSALIVEAGDLDVHIWETLRAGAQNYGYYMKYIGTGSGDANYLELWSHNAEASNELLMRWHQTSQVTEVAGNLTVSGGYINSPTDLFIEPTGHIKLNPTTYVHLESAAATSMYFDCGSIFQFRDVDASAAVVAEIASTTGGLTLGVATQTTDPIELLKFRTERAWSFRKRGTTSSTRLALESDVGDKSFWIGYDDGVAYAAKFYIDAVQADCTVQLAHDVTIDGNLDVDGGIIEIENSFEIEYNSTSDSLDFNYIG
jgi:hypothetical protein